jgi:hypothetical protein
VWMMGECMDHDDDDGGREGWMDGGIDDWMGE